MLRLCKGHQLTSPRSGLSRQGALLVTRGARRAKGDKPPRLPEGISPNGDAKHGIQARDPWTERGIREYKRLAVFDHLLHALSCQLEKGEKSDPTLLYSTWLYLLPYGQDRSSARAPCHCEQKPSSECRRRSGRHNTVSRTETPGAENTSFLE